MRSGTGNLNFGTAAIPSNADLASLPICLDQDYGFAAQVSWTGTPTGTWKLQGSCDKGSVSNSGTVSGVSNWSDISGASVAVAGAAGDFVFNASSAFYRYFRIVYTHTSGTGTITNSTYSTKGP